MRQTVLRAAPLFFIIALAIFGQARYTDVPYVQTPQKVVDAMLELAGVKQGDVLFDLGSGDGRIAIAAAKKYGIRATGIEIVPELVRESEKNAREMGVADK